MPKTSRLDFVQIVPEPKKEPITTPTELSVEEKLQLRMMYGVNVVCPNGVKVNVQQCAVDNLVILMRALK